MNRNCPQCQRQLDPFALRCSCGHELSESRDTRSKPDRPCCGVCDAPMDLMTERCPSCGADGYPAMRPRRGKKSLGPPS